ncbi:MAG: phage holin family protein [Pseudomonadales bacterium]|nr:phage holin family protein [Pseudomonadales bacterium]MCP5189093.1 phage holin family protein [Pseudomonadales bacterium]
MLGVILRTLITALGIWLATYLVPGVSATSTGALLWAAIALGLINAFVRPVLVLLTLPFTILTLGVFLLLLNAAMLNLAGWFVDGFEVVGFWSSVFGALVVSVVSGLCSNFIGPRGAYEVLVVRRR